MTALPPLIFFIVTPLIAILTIAFFTLLERKILGYAQLRKGPNKVGLSGLPQPFADALKLFTKEHVKPTLINLFPFLAAPSLGLTLALLIWALFPSPWPSSLLYLALLLFITFSSLTVYTTLAAGWTSNSKYALLGALRRVAQTISYEVRIIFLLLPIPLISASFNIQSIKFYQITWPALLLPPLILFWFTSLLAETNRTPFDFAEGESELVSGFNTEYSRRRFALIFMAEYTRILAISLLTRALFFTSSPAHILSLGLIITVTTFLASAFIWARGTLPRIRYDHLISLTWKNFLPIRITINIFLLAFLPL